MPDLERGGHRVLLEELSSQVTELATGGYYYRVRDLDAANVDITATFAVVLAQPDGSPVTESEITNPGTYSITRIRGGSDSLIVDGAAASEALGRVYCQYDFPAVSWQVGDLAYVVFAGITAVLGGEAVTLPNQVSFIEVVTPVSSTDVYDVVVDASHGNAALASLVGDVDTAVGGVASAVSDLDGDVASLASAVGDVDTAVDGVQSSLDDAEHGLSALDADLDGLDAALGDIDTVVDAVKLKTDQLVFVGGDVRATLAGEGVTVATNGDKSGYSLSGAKTTLDALNDLSFSDAQGAAEAALGAGITSAPAAKSLRDILHQNDSFTFDNTTDSLEAIRDRIDALRFLSAGVGETMSGGETQLLFSGADLLYNIWASHVILSVGNIAGTDYVDGTFVLRAFTHPTATAPFVPPVEREFSLAAPSLGVCVDQVVLNLGMFGGYAGNAWEIEIENSGGTFSGAGVYARLIYRKLL